MPVPSYDALFNPVLEAIHRLGGSASIAELDEEVSKTLPLSANEFAQLHDQRQTELQYRLGWARTYLKLAGYLNNSERGVWVLTDLGHTRSGLINPAGAG